jgi:uncharacterized protein
MRALHWRGAGLLLCSLVLLGVGVAAAKDFPPRPTQYVYDEANWLSRNEEVRLAARLSQFERDSSNQILVAIFRSLGDEDLADYSQQLAEHWGIGQKGRDNGILLVFYSGDRLLSIEVGYGLEPVVTDAIAAQIRDELLVPGLRGGDKAATLNAGVTALMAASRGEFEGTGRSNSDGRRRSKGRGFPLWIIWLIMIMLFGGGGRRGRRSWVGPVLYGAMLGSSGRRGGGGFGGGGFGGGGFSGGGGSFGGGGARGGW